MNGGRSERRAPGKRRNGQPDCNPLLHADSVPELEWKETEAKARAVIRAAEMVEQGL